MKIQLSIFAATFLMANLAFAQIAERPAPVPINSQFVPVDLNELANDGSTPIAASAAVSLQSVPFDLAKRGDNTNLFLQNAGWPKWKDDPLDYYSPYDNTPETPTDALPVVQIPVDDYSAVYVLASCESDPKYSNILSLRIGAKRGFARTDYHDYEFQIPRVGGKSEYIVSSLPNNVFLLRLPLNAALSQEFANERALDVEITKQIRLSVSKPDPARFQYRPLGLPSGVHLYGMTFERSPVRLRLRGTESGNIFNEPQTPAFEWRLDGRSPRPKVFTVRARATDYYGNVTEFPAEELTPGPLSPLPNYQRVLKMPVVKRGYYVLDLTIEGDGKTLLKTQTTFALLPKDTRPHRDESPFGTWDFGGTHFTPDDAETVGALYVQAGLRYGMFGYTPQQRARYGVIKGNDPVFNSGTDINKIDELLTAAKADAKASGEAPAIWMLFHEDIISGDHITRTPDLFTGKKYQLNEAEREKLAKMVELVRVAAPKIRKAFPGIKIYLGNGAPHLMEELLRSGIPPETFDSLGNEAASFQRLPESQPTDFIANNPSLWMENELLKHYKYENKDVAQAYEIGYPATNPGNLTLRQQANHTVRNAMHSLAWKVPVIRFGIIAEPGNSYYFGNWGGTGLMFAKPDLHPKPLFVATATMTQMLDGAKFSRIIPTGTTTIYAFEFRKPNGGFVTCLWTPNLPREVSQRSSDKITITDLMGNSNVLPTAGTLMAQPDPVFIETEKPLQVQADRATEATTPGREYSVISKLDDVSQWQLKNGEDDELEAYNFAQPRRDAEFAIQNVDAFDGKKNPLEVKPLQTQNKDWWLPRYTQLVAKSPIEIKGKPTHIGVSINGNGGWGRIIFELEDAAGQRWISLGTEQQGTPNPWLADWMSKAEFEKLKTESGGSAGVSDWNSNDAWGRSAINFVGWNRLQFPLPGNYPGEGYHWPYTSQWRCVKADGGRGDYVVHYPLKLTKLVITSRAKVLYGSEVLPVRRPEIYLQNLGVFYGDPDKDFWQADLGQR